MGTEAYLGTARRRQSLRRHARLVDYRIHEGCNARAWVHVKAAANGAIKHPQNMFLVSLPPSGAGQSCQALSRDDLAKMIRHSHRCEVVEPVESRRIPLWQGHNECHLYDWRGAKPCLPAGTTSAYLIDADDPAQALHLQRNDVVMFEEVLGPWTGSSADADRSHRHAVRITDVNAHRDDLFKVALVKIEWDEADALPFPLWISKPHDAVWERADGTAVTVVRGNIVLVDHGRKVLDDPVNLTPSHEVPPPAFEAHYPAARIKAKLSAANLTFSEGLARVGAAASAQLKQDPRRAVPQLVLHAKNGDRKLLETFSILELREVARIAERLVDSLVVGERHPVLEKLPRAARHAKQLIHTCGCRHDPAALAILGSLGNFRPRIQDDLRDIWMPRYDLIDSASTDSHFVVEMADDRQAHLRFGQCGFGRTPDPDGRPDQAEIQAKIQADYRIGNGAAGNAPAEAIRAFGFYGPPAVDIESVRNPLPAVGGVDPESSRQIRLFAPHAIRSQLQRAITAQDYEQIVMREFGRLLQRVKATLRWTGHEVEALVVVDSKGREVADLDLLQRIRSTLIPFRRIGHTVEVRGAERVIPRLALSVCIGPHVIREQVVNELDRLFSDQVLPNGTLAFFHPDHLTFGEGVLLSPIVAVASRVAGVIHAEVAQLCRRDEGPGDESENGVLPLRQQEIVRFDNNDQHPEFGILEIDLKGGR